MGLSWSAPAEVDEGLCLAVGEALSNMEQVFMPSVVAEIWLGLAGLASAARS